MLVLILEQIQEAQVRIAHVERALEAWAKNSEACRRLMATPGVGTMPATALVLAMGDPSRFRSGRPSTAWLGSVPKQHFVRGARSVARWRRGRSGRCWREGQTSRLGRCGLRPPRSGRGAPLPEGVRGQNRR